MQNQKNINLIYLVGTSFSGSTLLGFLLDVAEEVGFMGELKDLPDKEVEKICSCGERSDKCTFWAKYLKKNHPTFGKPNKLFKIKQALRLILGIKHTKQALSNTPDYHLLQTLLAELQETQPNINCLLDSSKTVWRLSHLLQCKGIQLQVVYLKRDFKNNVASFAKREPFGFWKGLMVYKINHFLIRRFLELHKIPVIKVQFENLCKTPEKELNRIKQQFQLNTNFENFQAKLQNRTYHVRAGNTETRFQFKNGFKGIQYDATAYKRHLSKFQLFLLNLLE
ncbi:MAG: hypothetical protein AB8B69_16915 [Chitinophagales bacterium]